MPSKFVGVLIIALIVIVGAAILVPMIMGFLGYTSYPQISASSATTKTVTVTTTNPSYTTTLTTTYIIGNRSYDAAIIFKLASPSVVQVTVYDKNFQQLALGSGFVYDDQGHVITNNHVVEGGNYFIIVTYDNAMYEAKLVGRDTYADLAVLKAGLSPKYPPLKLADTVIIGEPVYAIGSPFGLSGSITSGIVSQVNRTGITYVPMLQTDAAINPGNSGGPLLNSRGEVVGVATAGIEKSVAEGVGFAVPSTIVKRIVPQLITNGVYKHPYIGIYGEYLDPIIASTYGLPKDITSGFIITQIARNSPAEKSGLKVKDVIVAVDDYPIRKDPDLNYLMAYKYSPGDKIVITVIRDGKTVNISLTLAERP
ncbi:MAG: trypsin-like peptidase domain-containing protein [Nitrososphaeria archaeon]|nr:trypsin-like peptidase domain-containing protein [Nitrososphaeria archaeon]